ncbi:MAG: NUDIX hydrolase, partial [Halofilum sp. (in: g-proteobacteria)]
MTVAAVIETDGRYLVVEEMADGHRVFNQPAGHLEPDERLVDAVVREVLEEAGAHFVPEHIIGLYRWINPRSQETHLRVAFGGQLNGSEPGRTLDEPIIAPHWLRYDELLYRPQSLRSPLVMGCIDDYLRGCSYPLELL